MFLTGWLIDSTHYENWNYIDRDLAVHDDFLLAVNQGWREATCLAVLGDDALIEYEMPSGTTALRIVLAADPDGTYINMSYYDLPKKWLREMAAWGICWIGNPQQQTLEQGPPPCPAKILEE